MDNSHLTKYDPDKQGQYYVLDTTIDPSQTAVVPAMNGRQGDTMRRVPLAFVDDDEPHDLTNSMIELRAQDAYGVVKISDEVLNWVSRTGGLVEFGIPAPFYANAGEYQHAYFVISDKNDNGDVLSTSTVNVDFSVAENGIEVTAADTKIFISSVDRMLDDAKSRIESVKLLGENAEAAMKGYEATIKAGDFPTRSADNTWTGVNSFTTVNVDKLNAPVIDSLNNDVVTAQTTANSASIDATSAQSDINSVSSTVASLTTSTTSAVAAVSNKEAASESSTAKAVTSLSSAVSSIDADTTDIYTSTDSMSTAIASLVANVRDTPDYSFSLGSLSTAVSNTTAKVNSMSDKVITASGNASVASQGVNSLSSAIYSLQFKADSASDELSAYDLTSMGTTIAILQSTIKSAQSAGKL